MSLRGSTPDTERHPRGDEIDSLRAAGITITEISDKKAFQDAMKPVYDKFITDPKLKDMVSKIQATN